MGSPYSDPNNTVRREWPTIGCGGAAATQYAKFRTFQRMKLKQVHAYPTTAGGAGHKYDVYQGTTSVGTIAVGTTAAGGYVASGALNLICPAGQDLHVLTGTDTVGVADIVYEYEVLHDSVQTA